MIIRLNVIIVLLMSSTFALNGQNSIKGPIIICPAGDTPNAFHVLPPESFSGSNSRVSSSKKEIFEVEYIGFSEEAKESFQYAVEIWESILKTDVKIRVQATWEPLGTGVLGSAGAATYLRNFENAPKPDTWYPVALAEKIAGTDLNETTDFDIIASFNSEFSNWYLGTDGQAVSQFDLVTVVLHELGHGLGFISGEAFDDTNNTARWDLQETGFPMIFTTYLEDQNGNNILEVENNSETLADFLTSNNVFVNNDLVVQNNGSPAKVFSPSPYDAGSSISHWNEATFNNTENALMTPSVAPSEVIHHPGINTLSFFAEMGWFRTDISHEPILIADDASPLDFDIDVLSDTTLIDESFSLNYFYEGGDTTRLLLSELEAGKYSTRIDLDASKAGLFYYFDGLSDALNKNYRVPETGSFEVLLTSLNKYTPPFELSDGGDFEAESGFFGISTNSNRVVWERGVVSAQKFGQYSSTAWATLLEGQFSAPETKVEHALLSPLFDLSDVSKDYVLSFDYMADVSEFAYLGVYFSLDSGKHWQKLGAAYDDLGDNWYRSGSSGDFFNFNTLNTEGEIEVNNAFYPLYQLVGEVAMIKLSFQLLPGGDAEAYRNDGFLIDNFQILASDPKARFYSMDTTLSFPGNETKFFFASNGATSYMWDFGDGATSTENNPTHIYETGGSFDVSLTIGHPNGSDTFVRENYITIIENKGRSYSLASGGDFETNTSDFVSVSISGTPFQLGNSTIPGKEGVNSGDNAWVTGISDPEYENFSESYLYTPEFSFDILGNYELSFFANYAFENLWDGFIVEYTLNRGQSWQKLDENVREGWYDDNSDPSSVFGNTVPIFTGTTNGQFEEKVTDVSFLSGEENVSFRFTFLSDQLEVDAGLAIDDFELVGPEEAEINAEFFAEVIDGLEGCVGSTIRFTNESSGSVTGLQWYFGESASPVQGVGVGPFEVEFAEPGTYEVVLTAIDNNDNSNTYDTVINISELHLPIINQLSEGALVELSASAGDSYQWYAGEELIPGATNQIFTASSSGSYSVEVAIGACAVRTNKRTVVASTDVGQGVSVYPNPFSQRITISMSESYELLRIMDASGRLILEKPLDESQIVLEKDWALVNSGLYFFYFSSKSGRSTVLKMLKE